jgi:hypothetical protein
MNIFGVEPPHPKNQKNGDNMRKLITSVVIFVAGFGLSAVIDGRNLASLAKGKFSSPAVAEAAAQASQKPPTLQKWEYRVVTKLISSNQADIDFELNRLGEQGFEICEVVQSTHDNLAARAFLTIVLQRPK